MARGEAAGVGGHSYQPGSIRRRRRTLDQVRQLDAQILDVLRDDHPQSVRHIFYRMTDPRLPEPVEKSEHGYKQVQDRIAKLRRSGDLPYEWITDATRRGYHVPTYADEAEFIRRMAGNFRADMWRDAERYCEVWCESRSIAGVIQDECERLAVSLYPAGGFTSMTLAWQSAEHIRRQARGRPATILYIGDYDRAGILIDPDIERKIIDHLGPYVEIEFRRIAITEEQISDLDLPTKPAKSSDRRAMHIMRTVEAEAMPAAQLRAMLRQEVERLLPPDAVLAAQIEEQSALDYLNNLADLLEAGVQ